MIGRALVLRPIFHEKIRTILTILGIAVGVAVVVAIQLANQSALRAFRESVDAIAGRANYQIAGDTALDENLLIDLQPLWQDGVRFAPVIDVEGIIEPSQQPIRLLGVDLFSDLHFRDYKYAKIAVGGPAGEAPAAPLTQFSELFRTDSIILPAPFAREHGLAIGKRVTLSVLGHRRELTVRGILESQGPATAFNGAIAICDIATAQRNFGFAGKLSRIDLIVPDDTLLTKLRLPQGTRIERPSRRNERVERMLRAFRVNLFALAGVALLVGMFLVYNTVLISILRRRKDVGVLKTLGTSPRQIFTAFLGEGLLFGLAGSLIGLALGHLLAQAILKTVGSTINTLYVASRPDVLQMTSGVIALGLAVGILLSMLSALQPALEASRVRPSAMIRPGLQQRVTQWRGLALGAIACFVAGTLVSRLPAVRGISVAGYLAVLLVVAGFSLLAPMIVRATASLFSPLFEKLFGIVGRLAAASLPASLRRTSIASAALSLATGMMIAVALMVGSFRETVRIWVGQTIVSDLWLRPAKNLTTAQALFPEQVADEVQRLSFVQDVDRIRSRELLYEDALVTLVAGEFEVADRAEMPMLDPPRARDALRRPDGAIVSESFADKFHKRVGDVLTIGPLRAPIVGVYRDYSSDRGVIVIDRSRYIPAFKDSAVNTIVVFLRPGVDLELARRELQARFGPKFGAFVVTNAEVRREIMRIFDQTFMITYALLGIAIIVAVLGIVNTLSALILERTRELALLRVGGLSSRELTTMLVLESSLLGIASTVIGLVMGYALSWILIYVINKQSFGWTIDFHTPTALIAASLATTFLASVLAGLAPARLANRIDIAGALKM